MSISSQNIRSINNIRRETLRRRETERTSEVARMATDLQRQGLTRTEALKTAERLVPHV